MSERPPPRHGARVELTRSHVDADVVRYRAVAAFAGQTSEGDASVGLADGAVTLTLDPPPPDGLSAFTVAVLRRLWAHRRDEPG